MHIVERYLLAVPVVQDSQHHGNNGDNNEDDDQENSDNDPCCIATTATSLRASSSSSRVSWSEREVVVYSPMTKTSRLSIIFIAGVRMFFFTMASC